MRLIALLPFLLLVGACVAPGARAPADHLVLPGFWDDPPDCVVVLPMAGAAGAADESGLSAMAVERALARHLFGRTGSVIGPDRRDADAGRLALDLRHPGDRARYADLAACRHGAELTVAGGRGYAVVWAEVSIDLKARLIDLATGTTLWQARHHGSRGDGGVPASPLGLALAVGQASMFATDGDVLSSVLDDGLRALVATLPDTRAYAASRNSSVRPLSSRK